MHQPAETRAIESFARFDLIGCIGGIGVVVIVNGLFVREPGVWGVLPFLLLLAAALVRARQIVATQPKAALALVAAGNWVTALAVAALFPFLWPPMILAVLLPLVLATPFLDRRTLRAAVLATATVTAIVGAIGLLNDDGGVVDDIDDTFEFILVIGALGALTIPVALVVGQNNALQRSTITDLAASRRRVVEAADHERSRIERDLHDGAQQRLLAMRMRLQLLSAGIESTTEQQFGELTADFTADLDAAISELRELARGIYPAELVANGLADALTSAVRRSPPRFTSAIEPVGRMSAAVEQALYFTGLEAMSNAAKHTTGPVSVALGHDAGVVELVIADDGPGFDVGRVASSVGLASMADRIGTAGGDLTITSSERGTKVSVTVAVPPPD